MLRPPCIAFLMGVAVSSSAWAQATATVEPAATVEPVKAQATATATVQPVKAHVSINRGHGYKEVAASTEVFPGDQVMAGPGGHAKIVYAEGCVVDVYPGAVVGVAGSCKVATAKPMLAGLECDPNTDPKCLAPVAVPGTPWWVWPVAAGLIVGAACAGFCEEEEHHHPHSP
jgi:hypothetical protein